MKSHPKEVLLPEVILLPDWLKLIKTLSSTFSPNYSRLSDLKSHLGHVSQLLKPPKKAKQNNPALWARVCTSLSLHGPTKNRLRPKWGHPVTTMNLRYHTPPNGANLITAGLHKSNDINPDVTIGGNRCSPSWMRFFVSSKNHSKRCWIANSTWGKYSATSPYPNMDHFLRRSFFSEREVVWGGFTVYRGTLDTHRPDGPYGARMYCLHRTRCKYSDTSVVWHFWAPLERELKVLRPVKKVNCKLSNQRSSTVPTV